LSPPEREKTCVVDPRKKIYTVPFHPQKVSDNKLPFPDLCEELLRQVHAKDFFLMPFKRLPGQTFEFRVLNFSAETLPCWAIAIQPNCNCSVFMHQKNPENHNSII
jgi:hypothetical protein